MSRALAVFHGRFGRATLYQLNRPYCTHAHREGHLIFQVGGKPGAVWVHNSTHPLGDEAFVGVNPWEPHKFLPSDVSDGGLFFVLYVNPEWFSPDGAGGLKLSFGRTGVPRTAAITRHVRHAASMLCGARSLTELDNELRRLIAACHEQSWHQADASADAHPGAGIMDFRVRKSMKLISQALGTEIALDDIARQSGLSRPHFYKLFRAQTGVTPNLYINTLLMEKALDVLVSTPTQIADIGFDLGFSSQSGFTRFFAANVGMAPTDYRRAAKVLRA